MKKPLIWAIGTAFVLGATPVVVQAAKLDAVEKGKREARGKKGRESETVFITMGDKKLDVTGFAKVTIAGKEANREQLVAGMECEVEANGSEATKVDCK
jgi:hypothetical protein